jgi:hypothetical protein
MKPIIWYKCRDYCHDRWINEDHGYIPTTIIWWAHDPILMAQKKVPIQEESAGEIVEIVNRL